MTKRAIEKQEDDVSMNKLLFHDSSFDEQLEEVQNQITVVRGKQVMLDRDLARLYHVEVGYMNRQVKRNIVRFPSDFMFQLTKDEADALKCQNGISNTRGGDRALPYAFTEQGISMLSGLLRSETAIQANILIMRAFVSMRHFLFAMPKYFRGWTGWSINNWRPTIRLLYYSVNWRRVLYFRSKVSSSTAKFMMRMNS